MERYANKQNLVQLAKAVHDKYSLVATPTANGLMSAADKAKLDGIQRDGIASLTAKGHAEQVQTTGKNLLRNTATSKTVNGVTFTVNADGSVTCNGTASANAYLSVTGAFTLQAGNYVLSGCPSGGSTSTYGLYTQGVVGVHFDTGSGYSFTHDGSGNIEIVIVAYSGTTCNNLTFYPQLEAGSTATDYEPYTNGPSPSPDWPQEIQVVRGRNLLDPQTFTSHGKVYTVNTDGSVTVLVDDAVAWTIIPATELPAGTYTLSWATLRSGQVRYRTSNDNYAADVIAVASAGSATFTLASDGGVKVKLCVNGTSFPYTEYPQLEAGSHTTPYVPYGHVGLEVQGFNQWDEETEEGYIGQDGAYVNNANNWRTKSFIPVFPNTTYFLKSDATVRLCFYGANNQFLRWGALTNNQDFVVPSDVHYIKFFRGQELYTQGEICVNLSDPDRNGQYEPYRHTTTPIPLPSKGWAGSLPDGTADVLTLDGAGKVEWELPVGHIASYAGETVGTPYLSTTGQLTTGAEVYHKLATPTTEERGYADMPAIPGTATVSIPELDDLGVTYLIGDSVREMAEQWYARARSEYESRIASLEAAVAELATS